MIKNYEFEFNYELHLKQIGGSSSIHNCAFYAVCQLILLDFKYFLPTWNASGYCVKRTNVNAALRDLRPTWGVDRLIVVWELCLDSERGQKDGLFRWAVDGLVHDVLPHLKHSLNKSHWILLVTWSVNVIGDQFRQIWLAVAGHVVDLERFDCLLLPSWMRLRTNTIWAWLVLYWVHSVQSNCIIMSSCAM